MIRQLALITLFAITFGCRQSQTRNRDLTIVGQIDSSSIVGLWINQDFVKKLNQYGSITKASKETNFIASIVFQPDSRFEWLGYEEMEAVEGQLVGDSLKFDYGPIGIIKIISSNEIDILFKGANTKFKRLTVAGYENTYDGRNYLNSLIFIGIWKFVDPYLDQIITITFKENNQITGLADITTYYPSSYLDNDIVIFNNGNERKRSFIFTKENSDFALYEVKNFDWGDNPLERTGHTYRLKK